MRKSFSDGFSSKALSEQEGLIQNCVDLLVVQLNNTMTPSPGDIIRWYNAVTFDIMGELAFGEPFGSLTLGTLPL
jgi:hypothetical protein